MADAGNGDRIDSSRRRRASPLSSASSKARAPLPPRFINRLPKRLPPPLHKLHAGARERDRRPPMLGQPGPSNRALAVNHRQHGALASGVLHRTEASPSVPRECVLNETGPNQKGPRMRNPGVTSLDTVTLEEALSYLDAANGDELGAAFTLAQDRNRLDGSATAPDETEVHHALFLLRRVRGLDAPSFDLMRIQLRRRAA